MSIERKHELYHKISMVGKALGHETRLELIELLAQCPSTVEHLSDSLGLDIRSVSVHLKVLSEAGFVRSAKEGRFRRYFLTSADVVKLAVMLRRTAEKLCSECAPGRDGCGDELTAREAVARASKGDLLLIDVRRPDEYSSGHLPHAVNMPLDDIEEWMTKIEAGADIAAYCRGPCCFAAEAARDRLRERGICLSVVRTGVMEWSSDGLPLESDEGDKKNEALH